MNESYYFRTSDPDYIRHAPSRLEILSKAFTTIITQQESEHELQRLIHLLNKLKGSNRCYNIIAQSAETDPHATVLYARIASGNAFWRNWLCCMSCRGIQQNMWEWSCFSTRIRKLRRHGRTPMRSGRKLVVISRG